MRKTLNIAHRGASGVYPENTMIAFEKAVEMLCDGIETDVQLTKDGIPVLCHDETLERTTNGKGRIIDHSFQELRKLDAGIKKDKNFKGEQIPTLEELLQLVKEKGIMVNLELKNSVIMYKDLETKVIEQVHRFGLQDKVILSSFNHCSMVKCKEIDNHISTGLLYDAILFKPEKYAEYVGANALHPQFSSVTPETVLNAHLKGIAINTWTVNREEDMENLIKMKVDGIITNFPDKLAGLLRR